MQNTISGICKKNKAVSCSWYWVAHVPEGREKLRSGTPEGVKPRPYIWAQLHRKGNWSQETRWVTWQRKCRNIYFKKGIGRYDFRRHKRDKCHTCHWKQLLNFVNVHILCTSLQCFFTHKLINLVMWAYYTYLIIFPLNLESWTFSCH